MGHLNLFHKRRTVGLLLVCAGGVIAPGATLSAQELAPTKASDQRPLLDNPTADWGANFTNWLELSVGHVFAGGDRASFMSRQQVPAGTFGGIESFHFEQPAGSNGVLRLDGRGIFDNHDYDLRLDYTREGCGYLRAGFQEFQTWYDRHGGFYPPTGTWLTPFDEDVAVHRGQIWFEGGLRRPNVPEITFRYEHDYRDGIKDSTSWGDYNANPAGTPAINRNIVPSFLGLDEKRDSFALDLKHTIKDTDFGVGVRYETMDQDNARYILRRPGSPTAERYVTQKDGVDMDLFSTHAFTETRFNDQVLLTTSYGFTTLTTDISGSRIYGAGFDAVYDPTFARRQRFDEGFLGLNGGSTLDQHVGTINLLYTPCEHLVLLPSIRIESESESGASHFVSTDVGAPPAFTATQTPLQENNARDYIDVAESLEARYNGITNWLFYVRGVWIEDNGNLTEAETDPTTGDRTPVQNTDSDRLTQKYVAGLNWYPLARLNLAAQYYHKIHTINYENFIGGSTNTAYPGFLQDQNFDMDDVNFRITMRPFATLTLVTRYDFQLATIDTRADSLGTLQSANTTTHIIGQSVSWTPIARLFLQADFNYTLDETRTPANDLTGVAAGLVLPSENNYWNISFVSGYALNDKTDLQAQYYYYRADDYQNNSAVGLPYGSGAEEHGVTATLTRQISRAIRWTLKYGYFTNHDQLYGGRTDYSAHLVYSTLQYRF